jgi:hypothetical protein
MDNGMESPTRVEDRAFPDQSGQTAHTAGDVAGQKLERDGYKGKSNAPIELVDENRSEGLLPVFGAGRLDLYVRVASQRRIVELLAYHRVVSQQNTRTCSCAAGMSSARRSLSVGCFAVDKRRAETAERRKGEPVLSIIVSK